MTVATQGDCWIGPRDDGLCGHAVYIRENRVMRGGRRIGKRVLRFGHAPTISDVSKTNGQPRLVYFLQSGADGTDIADLMNN